MKNQKGITLIALIITIIVMLILVSVSVTVAIQTNLFGTASDVSQRMNTEAENETRLSDGNIYFDDGSVKDISSIDRNTFLPTV